MNLDAPPFAKKPMPGASDQQVIADPAAGGGGGLDAIEEIAASPEEQKIYSQYMSEAYKLMADEKAFPALEKMLDEDPVNAIADATVAIIEKTEENLGPVEDTDILLAMAGEEIIPQFAELATEKGTDVPEEKLEEILAVAAGEWSKRHPDRIPGDAMQQIGTQAQSILGQAAPQGPQGPTASPAQGQPEGPAPVASQPQGPSARGVA